MFLKVTIIQLSASFHLTSHLTDGELNFLVAESLYEVLIYDSVPSMKNKREKHISHLFIQYTFFRIYYCIILSDDNVG